MFAATRVMAAGKAGLESLPYFVDELLAQGITQLAPWAADHNQEQIERLNNATQERRAGPWKNVYDIGDHLGASNLGTIMQPDMVPTNRLLQRVNPLAAEAGLADSPAQLAAWCRGGIWQHCADTFNLWDRFKYDNGTNSGEKLAVVIPFCPEGPTSGTVGMYLGAGLRKFFADKGRESELVVWGIELCPPIDIDHTGEMDALAVQNVFRGYLAREELLQGVPLSTEANDTTLYQPFDVNIVFDGGTTIGQSVTSSKDDIWKALDRAAAQTTACLLNGAAGGDVDESTNWMKQGKRWSAYLVHVISELSYNSACRYLLYRVNLPWHRSRETWDKASTTARREAFLRRIDYDILPMLADEKDSLVSQRIEYLVKMAEPLRRVKGNFFTNLFNNKNKEIQGLLDQVIEEEQHLYDRVSDQNQAPDRIITKTDPFCVNIVLPDHLRQEAAERWRDNSSPDPVGDVLGVNGALAVRGRIESLFSRVLERNDYKLPDKDSQANFEQIIGISIEDWSRDVDNEEFRPAREFLVDFIGSEHQHLPGSFNTLTYDLSEKVQYSESPGNGGAAQPKALRWQLPKEANYDIPVEYSFLTLSRCGQDDGFKDVSTYDELKKQHDQVVNNLARWRDYARYYSINPPPELVKDGVANLPDTTPADAGIAKGQEEPDPDTNGHRTEPYVVTETPNVGQSS